MPMQQIRSAASFADSKPHYNILDGLRGVASVLVILFHLFETYSAGAAEQIINHGYLAVDFFFVLSGFVVGYAYDDRWDRMSVGGFFKRRLIRLHPMVIMGTVIGASLYFFGQCDGFPLIGHVPGWKVLLAFVMGCLMIPCGMKMDLGILTAVAAFCTLDLCLDWNVFGLLTDGRDALRYTVIGGWSLTPEQIYIGLTRLMYPFLCGLLLSRIGRFIKVKGGFWWCSLILVVLFAVPCIGGAGNILNGVYNAVCILICFPLIVMMGAGSEIKGQRSTKICTFLGQGIARPFGTFTIILKHPMHVF